MLLSTRRMTLIGAGIALLMLAACNRPISSDIPAQTPATATELPPLQRSARPTAAPVIVEDPSPFRPDPDAQPLPEPFISPEQITSEGRLDIGGRALHLACFGKGEPVVVFDMGFALREPARSRTPGISAKPPECAITIAQM